MVVRTPLPDATATRASGAIVPLLPCLAAETLESVSLPPVYWLSVLPVSAGRSVATAFCRCSVAILPLPPPTA